ncbi:MAG: aconitate hydratase, partial [Clostridiaceae bacterium]|nr:aconitate hydratase [Clostridiaceae bacterium]
MGKSLTEKIIERHLLSGSMQAGEDIGIRIDQTLTQDSTGTMAYLQFEQLGLPRVQTKLSVSYVDHGMLQSGFENADDHKYLQTVAARYGVRFSRPGNGVCHQVHVERFGVPGDTLLGSDSHTPTCGGIGMLAIGAGGLDVAVAMGGGAYYIKMPEVMEIRLTGSLQPWVTAKDIILEVLRRLTVKGGVGKVMEYTGPGVAGLSVPERATITNMGAELGATTSIFPSDDMTRAYLRAQKREEDWSEQKADPDAVYAATVEIDLDSLEPLIAFPSMPDKVHTVAEAGAMNIKVEQVHIGSCTNSSFTDMMKVAALLEGKTAHPDVSLVIAPGSKQVFNMLARNGGLMHMISAGARILEAGCGPCIGMGQSPRSGAVSLRTINRNFYGRSGTPDAQVYLVSPETAVAAALNGVITDPRTMGEALQIASPEEYEVNDNMIIIPPADGGTVEVVRGPNIKPVPEHLPLPVQITQTALIKVEDNITTDHIMPSTSKLLPFRSNVPKLAEYCLTPCDPSFPERAKAAGGGMIIAGHNYGQGSSREHAALAPLALVISAVVAKSFARIHQANLINNGILPLVFDNENDYDSISVGDVLRISEAPAQVNAAQTGAKVVLQNVTRDEKYVCSLSISPRERDML